MDDSQEQGDVTAQVLHLERRTLDPVVRRDVAELASLLHPDFVEHGGSGRVWGRDDVAAAVAGGSGTVGEILDLRAVPLAADVVLVTYRLGPASGSPGSLRSSVWLRDGAGWLMRFHQGTALAPRDQA